MLQKFWHWFKLHPDAFKALRSRSYRSLIIVIAPVFIANQGRLTNALTLDGISLGVPRYVAAPLVGAIIAAVLAWLGAHTGSDPRTTYFTNDTPDMPDNAHVIAKQGTAPVGTYQPGEVPEQYGGGAAGAP